MVSLFSVMNFDFLTENSLFFSSTYISKTGKIFTLPSVT